MSQHDTRDCDKPKLYKVTIDKSQFDNPLLEPDTPQKEITRKITANIELNTKELIRLFCEQVNNLACENMLQPPYKLEGQHKRAMVILCKQLGITLTFGDET